MTTSAPPITAGGSVPPRVSILGEKVKIYQRIQPGAGSNQINAHSMADADDDLVLQCRNGNAEAFEALVRKHQQMIHALTFRMTGSNADAEDLAQEAFIRAYQQIRSFDGRARFATWLYSIAIHACLNWRRDEARRFRAQADCAEEMLAQRQPGETAENSLAGQAQEALLTLAPKQRAALVLTVYDGLTHAEAGRILHCSETTISWRVFAAKRKLKKILSRPPAHKFSCFTRPPERQLEAKHE